MQQLLPLLPLNPVQLLLDLINLVFAQVTEQQK